MSETLIEVKKRLCAVDSDLKGYKQFSGSLSTTERTAALRRISMQQKEIERMLDDHSKVIKDKVKNLKV